MRSPWTADAVHEIHFAGAAGLHIKGTEFLAKVATEEETLEVIAAQTSAMRPQTRRKLLSENAVKLYRL